VKPIRFDSHFVVKVDEKACPLCRSTLDVPTADDFMRGWLYCPTCDKRVTAEVAVDVVRHDYDT